MRASMTRASGRQEKKGSASAWARRTIAIIGRPTVTSPMPTPAAVCRRTAQARIAPPRSVTTVLAGRRSSSAGIALIQ